MRARFCRVSRRDEHVPVVPLFAAPRAAAGIRASLERSRFETGEREVVDDLGDPLRHHDIPASARPAGTSGKIRRRKITVTQRNESPTVRRDRRRDARQIMETTGCRSLHIAATVPSAASAMIGAEIASTISSHWEISEKCRSHVCRPIRDGEANLPRFDVQPPLLIEASSRRRQHTSTPRGCSVRATTSHPPLRRASNTATLLRKIVVGSLAAATTCRRASP